jgi:hypothetical protein
MLTRSERSNFLHFLCSLELLTNAVAAATRSYSAVVCDIVNFDNMRALRGDRLSHL